jgi:hypothetical protein
MNIIEFIAQDVFDKVRGRFSNLEMGDDMGAVTTNPKEARFFDFDFMIEGNNIGRVSISLNELGSLKIYYSQGITEDTDSITLSMWYDFLKEMRFFAKRRMLRFDTRDITKGNLNKSDFQYLAQNKTKDKGMNESSMYGSTKTSYRKLENTLLRIRHSKAVNEDERGARSRHINALFIENHDGERFKYPFIHLEGAKAMQRHVANGGRPYDDVGKSIIEMSEKISQLVAFKRHVGKHDGMNQDVNEILEKSQYKLEDLRKTVKGLTGQKFYEAWVENFQPQQDDGFVMDQATMEDYKSKFTKKDFKEDLAQYFPLIHKIMQETGELDLENEVRPQDQITQEESDPVDDFEVFENWADEVAEIDNDDLPAENIEESPEDRTSYQVAKILFDKGIKYDPSKEDDLISAIGMVLVKELNMSVKHARHMINYDEDFVSDTMSELSNFRVTHESDIDQQDVDNQEPNPEKPNMKEIAEVVKSFYDKETGKFPKGETGVVTHCKKQFGETGGKLAERLVSHLSQQGEMIEQQKMAQQQFEEIKKLAGLAKIGQ